MFPHFLVRWGGFLHFWGLAHGSWWKRTGIFRWGLFMSEFRRGLLGLAEVCTLLSAIPVYYWTIYVILFCLSVRVTSTAGPDVFLLSQIDGPRTECCTLYWLYKLTEAMWFEILGFQSKIELTWLKQALLGSVLQERCFIGLKDTHNVFWSQTQTWMLFIR